jgi:DNA-binding NarL/FixJ family response regulator
MSDSNSPLNVIIADNQYLITTSLKSILQNEKQYLVNQIVTNKPDLFKALKSEFFSILIVDFAHIDFDSLSDLKKVKKEYPCLAILILTNSISKNELIELNGMGIHNIILKTIDRDELFSAIEATAKHKKCYSEEILEILFELNDKKQTIKEPEKQLTQKHQLSHCNVSPQKYISQTGS